MSPNRFEPRSPTEEKAYRARINRVYPPTGEIVGDTAWRRWRTESGWHPDTPASIVEEYDWLFEFGPANE
jgi:hypothetical protein